MLKIPSKAQLPLRLFAIVMSAGLFVYLIWRAGPSKLWKSLSELGWGIILVLALAGVSHLARTWGWRLTLGDDQHKISFSRMVGLRLGAEAAGQLGILGQTLWRFAPSLADECRNSGCQWSRLGDSRSRTLRRNGTC